MHSDGWRSNSKCRGRSSQQSKLPQFFNAVARRVCFANPLDHRILPRCMQKAQVNARRLLHDLQLSPRKDLEFSARKNSKYVHPCLSATFPDSRHRYLLLLRETCSKKGSPPDSYLLAPADRKMCKKYFRRK